jgi:predicted TIM-barrel fold metal-dependent hydrolase
VHLLDAKAVPDKLPASRKLVFSSVLDFRKPGAAALVRRARAAGFAGVKVLTYEQDLLPKDYPALRRLARAVEEAGMFLTLCATFGGKKLYRNDAIAAASHLLSGGYTGRLVLAHAGGSRAREALLLMDDAPNVYADTSFTTSYWAGSPVIDDLAYLVNRLPDRCFFGSDAPFVAWDKALADAQALLKRLPEKTRRKVLHDNAAAFLKGWL